VSQNLQLYENSSNSQSYRGRSWPIDFPLYHPTEVMNKLPTKWFVIEVARTIYGQWSILVERDGRKQRIERNLSPKRDGQAFSAYASTDRRALNKSVRAGNLVATLE